MFAYIKKYLFNIFAIALLLAIYTGAVYAQTPAGTVIESFAEISHSYGSSSSEVTIVIVDQMYGTTMEPVSISKYGTPDATYYFSHNIENVGNGTDNMRFHFQVATPAAWSFSLIKDDDGNGSHDAEEVTPLSNPLVLSEEGLINFFVVITVPSAEFGGITGEARLIATGEVDDGGTYIGADGTIYGGPDTVEIVDTLELSAFLAELEGIRFDATDNILLEWQGGAADIHYIEGTYEASFAGSSIEASSVTSPFTLEVSAQDGITRFYRISIPGTSSFLTETIAKVDIELNPVITLTSLPIVFASSEYSALGNVIGNQLTGGTVPKNADTMYSFQGGVWKQAFLKTGDGWTGTLTNFDPDVGAWIKIQSGHPSGYLTYLGLVSTASREITLDTGVNLVGSAYPVEVDLNDSGLAAALTAGTVPKNSDTIYSFEGGTWMQAYLKSGVGFVGTLTKFKPGRGYWIKKQGAQEIWYYSRPY